LDDREHPDLPEELVDIEVASSTLVELIIGCFGEGEEDRIEDQRGFNLPNPITIRFGQEIDRVSTFNFQRLKAPALRGLWGTPKATRTFFHKGLERESRSTSCRKVFSIFCGFWICLTLLWRVR